MIAYTLKQDGDGQWSLRCTGSILASGLPLESALRQAHQMAHATRMESGRPTCVEVISAGAESSVADQAPPEPHWRRAMA